MLLYREPWTVITLATLDIGENLGSKFKLGSHELPCGIFFIFYFLFIYYFFFFLLEWPLGCRCWFEEDKQAESNIRFVQSTGIG